MWEEVRCLQVQQLFQGAQKHNVDRLSSPINMQAVMEANKHWIDEVFVIRTEENLTFQVIM